MTIATSMCHGNKCITVGCFRRALGHYLITNNNGRCLILLDILKIKDLKTTNKDHKKVVVTLL